MDYKFAEMTRCNVERAIHDIRSDITTQGDTMSMRDMIRISIAERMTRECDSERIWYVDEKNDSYLYLGINMPAPRGIAEYFTFFYKGKIYFLERFPYSQPPLPVNVGRVQFYDYLSGDDARKLGDSELKNLKMAIESALTAYGRFGEPNEKNLFKTIFVGDKS